MGRQSPVSTGSAGAMHPGWPLAAAAVILIGLPVQVGCTSAITSATLREALRQTAASVSPNDHASKTQPAETTVTDPQLAEDQPDIPEEPVPSLEEAIDRAVARLSSTGGVDDATRAVLVQTLQTTRPRDWPAVVDEFVAALEEGGSSPDVRPAAPASTRDTVVAPAEPAPEPISAGPGPLRFPAAATEIVAPQPAKAPATLPTSVRAARPIVRPVSTTVAMALAGPPAARIELIEPVAADEIVIPPADPPAAAADAASGPDVRNACFATRVRAWGVVDRFPRAAFRPGQEVLIYFELENLLSRQSAAGHTTGVDTAFRLVAPDGEPVNDWTFPPLVETCHAPRRDYFVRYFLTVPEELTPGQYRLEFLVTDTLAGGSTESALDLEVLPAQ